jgi:DNA-binding MarR family transcriptional regulator
MARRERAGERVSAKPIGAADYQRLAAFRHVLRRFLAFSEAAARQAGIPPQQHQALLAIKGAPSTAGVTVGYLAGQLLLQPNSAAELVDRMVNCGLLARGEAPDDRRRVVLSLTPSAEKALQALSAAHIRELQDSAPVLDSLLELLKPGGAKRRKRLTGGSPARR